MSYALMAYGPEPFRRALEAFLAHRGEFTAAVLCSSRGRRGAGYTVVSLLNDGGWFWMPVAEFLKLAPDTQNDGIALPVPALPFIEWSSHLNDPDYDLSAALARIADQLRDALEDRLARIARNEGVEQNAYTLALEAFLACDHGDYLLEEARLNARAGDDNRSVVELWPDGSWRVQKRHAVRESPERVALPIPSLPDVAWWGIHDIAMWMRNELDACLPT